MAYTCYMTVTIRVENMKVKIKNAKVTDGKFHRYGNQTLEIKQENINGIEIKQGESSIICACGRDSTAVGTEGSFELYDVSMGEQSSLGKFFWSAPYSGFNNFNWTPVPNTDDQDGQYASGGSGGNFSVNGTLGDTYLACIKTY